MALAKEFGDAVECKICKQVYADPRILPCGHTFCFKCIDEWRSNRQQVHSMSCPLCRNVFTYLPSELPKNYSFMDVLGKIKESGSRVYCGEHVDRAIEIYCTDCKTAICTMCAIKSHNGHGLSDSDDLRKQMADDVVNVTSGIDKCREMLQSVEKKKKDLTEELERAKVEINMTAEQLKQMIDAHREKLLNELSSTERMKEIESLRKRIEKKLSSMGSYEKYVDEMRQKGTACEIVREASGLHDRADELLKSHVTERKVADLGDANVTLTSSKYVNSEVKKALRHLCLNVSKAGYHLSFINCCISSLPPPKRLCFHL